MTIKKRFLISYLSAIFITLFSVLLLLALATYVTLGTVPTIPQAYKMMTKQRPLTETEEESYLALDRLLKKSPELFARPISEEVQSAINEIEAKDLSVVIRKSGDFPYYSDTLVKKSLVVHAPAYETNNFRPTGTLDNNGRLFHYVKSDFRYLDGTNGSFIILTRESNLFEFFTHWGIWVVLFILSLAFFGAWLINYRLKKTTIEPLEALDEKTQHFQLTAPVESQPALIQTGWSSEVRQLYQSFEQMQQDLYASEQQRKRYEENRKELVANISHDLKTPITSIIGYVEGLLDGVAATEEKKQAYLRVIHEKSLGLNELIEELFLYSKLEIDEIQFSLKELELVSFITHILEEEAWPEAVLLKTDFPDNPLMVSIDSLQMKRVITNLLQNSLKFADPNKSQLILNLRIDATADEIRLTLSDNGIGIEEQELAHVFKRFYRADKSRNPMVKGSGLGLSIVQQIMTYHRGQIQLTSHINIGTTVTLILPRIKE